MGEVLIDRDNAIEISALGLQLEAVEDKIIVVVDAYKSGFECKTCKGAGKVPSDTVQGALRDCDECHGIGEILVIPEISKSLPTLGTVVSLGPKCQWHLHRGDTNIKDILIRPGAKVLFNPHVGTLIPFKGNIRLKVMREHEPLCVIYGADVDSKNFMDYDVPFEQRV